MKYTENSDARLRNEINELGHILGSVLKEQEGNEIFDKVEKLRSLTKSLRAEENKQSIEKIKEIIETLTLEQAHKIVRAFSIYFILINAADEVHQLRQQRYHRLHTKKIQKGSLKELEKSLSTIDAEKFEEILKSVEIIPVFTAHPTEATRQTILKKIQNLSRLLIKRDLAQLGNLENEKLSQLIKTEVTLLWQTSEIRFQKVTIEDEIQRGLFFLKNLYHVIPEIQFMINQSFTRAFGKNISTPPLLKFGTWMGGDRDGHPFVTAETSKNTLTSMKVEIINLYLQDLEELYQSLSSSEVIINADKNLLFEYERNIKVSESKHVAKEPSELYRKKLRLIHKKLTASKDKKPDGYLDAMQFVDDLVRIDKSLRKNKGALIADNLIQPLIYKALSFGFHLAQMDIRQNAKIIEAALEDIFATTKVELDFISISEEQKIELLTKEILSARPLINSNLELTENTIKILDEVELIRWGKENISSNATSDFIISNCAKVSDVLSLLLLAKERGVIKVKKGKITKSLINILPLFETVDDLRNSTDVMESLFNNKAYKQNLVCNKNIQKIMIGYSDSNKDGGLITSNFELYNSQIRLKNLCEKYGFEMIIFHGRGGSISRGGGPVNQSILAQPDGTIKGKIKLTEQGEMISSKYLIEGKAIRSLELIISAVIRATLSSEKNIPKNKQEKHQKLFADISEKALIKYRELIDTENFIEYFRTATPIDIIEKLEIGSRPASRKKSQDISSLRAIPWVFSWTQNRQTISGWYGFGTAIDKAVKEGLTNWKELNYMFKNWEFFKALVSNLEMVLTKTDMIIGSEYSKLCSDKKTGEKINSMICNEYQLSKECVLKITGEKELLDHNTSLQRSLSLRNPYIDPISFIQLKLIRDYRAAHDAERNKILSVLRSTVNGIAAGIRNTG